MKRIPIYLLLAAFQLSAARVPRRYIVELDTEPVTEHVRRTAKKQGMRGAAATGHRSRIRSEQQGIRPRLERYGTVLGSVDTVANAMFVRSNTDDVSQLRSMPGVRKVYPVRTFHMVLDHAVQVNRVTDAWNRVGLDRAGEGVRIAIIDSGVDSNHPGLQDPSLGMPATFPRFNLTTDQAHTNSKVIVARSYVDLLSRRDPDPSASDRVGHGTALAMIAAGVKNAGPLATITGVAPRAYLGNYKVFGSPGYNDGATDDAILKAIDDAVADGMDIINLSLGSDIATRLEDDIEVRAVDRATQAGVIVIAAAGNAGSDLNTISSPGTAPSAITVGASKNDRTFAVAVEVSGLAPLLATVGDGPAPAAPVTSRFADVATIDSDGLACASLPSGSLQGRIAIIMRGTCSFEAKLNNAQRAGAVAAVVYAAESAPDRFGMSVGTATLPAESLGHADGIALRNRVSSEPEVFGTLRFTLGPVPIDSTQLASFSGAGPNVNLGVKPDVVAVGTDFYTATQKLDSAGDMYSANGYISVGGTSFSTPLVAGIAAILKSARPGLTVDQYRSLIINAASALPSRIQQSGAGLVNALGSLQASAAISPSSLNLATSKFTITNIGPADETYSIAVNPREATSVPVLGVTTVQIAAGASVEIPLNFDTTGLAAGAYEGFVNVLATSSGIESRVPYWYGLRSETPASIKILDSTASGRRAAVVRDAILFRLTDGSGIPLTAVQPDISVVSGGGAVVAFNSYDLDVPGLFGVDVRLGPLAGTNVFRIQAGALSVDVTVSAR